MKHVRQMLLVAGLVAGFIPSTGLFAQHESHHPKSATTETKKAEEMRMSPMATMMAKRQQMEKLVASLIESFDKVRTLNDPGTRQAAIEEHARLLTQLRDALQSQQSNMAEMMKMCPMMEKSSMHQEQKQPQE